MVGKETASGIAREGELQPPTAKENGSERMLMATRALFPIEQPLAI
jgi:hypothetical protein